MEGPTINYYTDIKIGYLLPTFLHIKIKMKATKKINAKSPHMVIGSIVCQNLFSGPTKVFSLNNFLKQ